MANQSQRRSKKKWKTKSNQRAGRLPSNSAPIEVKINHIGGRGDGVGKVHYTQYQKEEEHNVFVPGSLPGELLLVKPVSLTAQGMKAKVIELLSSSPERNAQHSIHFQHAVAANFSIGVNQQYQLETNLVQIF